MSAIKISIGVIVLLIVLNLWTTHQFSDYKSVSQAREIELRSMLVRANEDIDLIRYDFRKHLVEYFENESYSPGSVELIDINNRKTTLRNEIKHRTLLYRIPENVCSVCYDTVIQQLTTVYSKIGSKNIAVIIPSRHLREFKRNMDRQNIDINIYVASHERSLGVATETHDAPFFMITDDGQELKHLFVPLKLDPSLTADYLETMRARYF